MHIKNYIVIAFIKLINDNFKLYNFEKYEFKELYKRCFDYLSYD